MMKDYLSIDIGGTQIKYAIVHEQGVLFEKGHSATPDNLTDFLTVIDDIILTFHDRVNGVAISCPGKVDSREGVIYFGGSLPFLHGLNLPRYIVERFGLVTTVVNDAKAAAMAELWLGNLSGVRNGLAIILGTGVGGGIICEGTLLQGQHFQAGELSFMTFPNEGNTIENLAGVQGSAVRMIEKIATVLGLEDTKNGIAVFEAINEKDSRIYPIFESYCHYIAYIIYNVQAIIDMDRAVIGGGISIQPIVLDEIKRQYTKILERLGFIKSMITPLDIRLCAMGNDANLLGAFYQFLVNEAISE
ncbi:ROK family protein [Tuanshanicoccus lijuaniae]|uniref:ROK family protein n=1 Tax=Aerococcaceae bacterium zg-1292 TaxID=2774330 RepID=UPI001BD840B4|nr:ROK family protein [Aerococcaceae bacterium zg-A91]MBS4457503.1 ROK family protein [Aerococcaceae bacterium zg-BR33]